MVILIVVEFGNNISTAVLSNRVGNKIYLTFSIQSFIIKSSIVFGLCMQTISKWQGPTANLEKAWKSIRDAVNIGDPEPYDCYFGCMHREFENIRLPKEAHPFAFAFDAKTSAAAQHRTQDWWEHDESNTAWIRHHVQPRKRLRAMRGERV